MTVPVNPGNNSAQSRGSSARLLTGDRPTGALHLGHLVGSLRARVAHQDSHECFLLVADLHALTTRAAPEQIQALPGLVRGIVLDLLSAGIDPERTTIYLQSGVPAVYDLAVLLQMITPAAKLRDLESLSDMARVAGIDESERSLGLLAYPVLQAADILMAQAELIPVGGDNVAHVELARELATEFNRRYGETFALPAPMQAQLPLLPGLDASPKMSKSAGNTLSLRASSQEVADAVAQLPESVLGAYLQAFAPGAQGQALAGELQSGSLSPAAARERLGKDIEAELAPIRDRRAQFEADPGRVDEILVDGTLRAREIAYQTLAKARTAMGLEGLWQGLVDTASARAEERKKPAYAQTNKS